MNLYGTTMALVAMLFTAVLATQACAGESGNIQISTMKHEQGFIAIKNIDGVHNVIFHIMRAPDGTGYSRNEYHVMVSIEKNKVPLHGLKVSSEVIHPDDSKESVDSMVELGDWYMARYKLGHDQGKHLVSVRFSHDGISYVSSIYYPE